MSWNYAELSKLAKKYGGPEKLIKAVEKAAKMSGRNQMKPFIVLAYGAGALTLLGVQKVVSKIKDDQKQAGEEAEIAKAKLIKAVKEYDEAYPEHKEIEGEEDPHNKEEEPNDNLQD